MNFIVSLGPIMEIKFKEQFDYFVKTSYRMFPEMEDEFNPHEYPEQ